MMNEEFCARILAKLMIEAGVNITIGGEDTREIMESMVKDTAMQMLKEIRDVLNDHTIDDPTCFERIEKLVEIYEAHGLDGGSRHDFG